MTFLELAQQRSSIRAYRPDPVPEEQLQAVLAAGRLAPSACNLQPWHIVVVRDAARRAALGEAYARDWFMEAPVILVVCVEPGKAWIRKDGKNYVDVDGAILMDHLTLCAADLGLGTCWIGAFKADIACAVLGLPDGVEPLAMTPLGYPAESGRPKQRKPMEELVHYEQW